MKQLGIEWKSLTEAQKAPYRLKSDELLTEYSVAKNAYRAKAPLDFSEPAEQPKKLIRRLLRKFNMQVM